MNGSLRFSRGFGLVDVGGGLQNSSAAAFSALAAARSLNHSIVSCVEIVRRRAVSDKDGDATSLKFSLQRLSCV